MTSGGRCTETEDTLPDPPAEVDDHTGRQSLPREISLPEDGMLRQKPLRELQSLRYDKRDAGAIDVAAGQRHRLEEIAGPTTEISVVFELTVYLDNGMVDEFANDRQAVTTGLTDGCKRTGVELFATGGDVTAKVKGWKMRSTY